MREDASGPAVSTFGVVERGSPQCATRWQIAPDGESARSAPILYNGTLGPPLGPETDHAACSQTDFPTVLRILLTWLPRKIRATMATIAISARMSAYSASPWPSSSRAKSEAMRTY